MNQTLDAHARIKADQIKSSPGPIEIHDDCIQLRGCSSNDFGVSDCVFGDTACAVRIKPAITCRSSDPVRVFNPSMLCRKRFLMRPSMLCGQALSLLLPVLILAEHAANGVIQSPDESEYQEHEQESGNAVRHVLRIHPSGA